MRDRPAKRPRGRTVRARRRAAATLALTLVLVARPRPDRPRRRGPSAPDLAGDRRHPLRPRRRPRPRSASATPRRFAVLLRGPAGAIERQGRRLASGPAPRPDADRDLALGSGPRGPQAARARRPARRPDARSRALLLLDFHVPLAEAMRDTVPELEDTLDAHIHPPVRATQSGFATISRALQHESLAAAERAELLAAPLLLLVLLLVFRSVLAALIPLAFGAITVFAGRGVLVFLTSLMPIDALSLVVCTMMGLALGVDYSLLIVSRFREELAAGRAPAPRRRDHPPQRRAHHRDRRRHPLLLDLPLRLLPARLAARLARRRPRRRHRDRRADRLGLASRPAHPARPAHQRRPDRPLPPRRRPLPRRRRRLGRPAPPRLRHGRDRRAAAAALRARPRLRHRLARGRRALALQLARARTPKRSPPRSAPAGRPPSSSPSPPSDGPLTSRSRLALLTATQRRIAALPGVDAVIGPAAIAAAARPLRSLGADLEPGGSSSAAELTRLGPRLRQASGAVSEIRGGLGEASAGGGLLGEGSARAGEGAELLAGGLDQAGAGGERASGALERLASGSERLAKGQRVASGTASNLSLGLGTLLPNLTAQGLGRARQPLRPPPGRRRRRSLARARRPRSRSPRLRPRHQPRRTRPPARPGPAASTRGLGKLYSGGKRLQRRLRPPRRRSAGPERRPAGTRLAAPSASPAASANCRAAPKPSAAASPKARARAYPLQQGLSRAGRRVSRAADPLAAPPATDSTSSRRGSSTPATSPSPRSTAPSPVRRSLAAEVIDVSGGGTAARYLIVPDSGFNTPGSRRLDSRLRALAGGDRPAPRPQRRPQRRRRRPQRLRRGDQIAPAASSSARSS